MPARPSDAIKVLARDGHSYAYILKKMKAIVDIRRAGLKVLSIRRTRKEEVLLVLKKGGGGVSAFCFGEMNTVVIQLAEADATRLLQLGRVKIGWVACRIREHAEVA